MPAVAMVLAARRPPGATAVLLAYLPCAEEDGDEAALITALEAVGLREGKAGPALLAALTDKNPRRRAAVAHVLGRAPTRELRRPVLRLLADPVALVRFEAATTLVRSGDKTGVPALLGLLAEAPLPLALQVEELLNEAAAETGPEVGLGSGSPAARRKSRRAWEKWWKAYGPRLDLAQLGLEQPLRGRTLVTDFDGRVLEIDKRGKTLWALTDLQGPTDAQILPGGRVLVAERNGNQVTERDRRGKVFWRHSTAGSPIACQRLGNGNTLIATFHEVYEIATDGHIIFRHRHPEGFRFARKLRNGHVVFISSGGQVVELDERWKQVRALTPASYASGAGFWASVEALRNGHYLLALGGAGRVVEIDQTGKIRWECVVPEPVHATRLRNGNILVASFGGHCLVEMDRKGKEVYKHVLVGRPFTIRRY